MRLLIVLFIISMLLLQSCINHDAENKKADSNAINNVDSGLAVPAGPPDTTLPPPPPPPPPIPREDIIEAKKLAADYAAGQSLADKKYKKQDYPIFVEGIVKDIKETDDYGVLIILDGAPSPIDVQCEILNKRRTRNLTKGMKALFMAHCDGLKGNVILSGCFYVQNPTYE